MYSNRIQKGKNNANAAAQSYIEIYPNETENQPPKLPRKERNNNMLHTSMLKNSMRGSKKKTTMSTAINDANQLLKKLKKIKVWNESSKMVVYQLILSPQTKKNLY